MRFLVTGVAGFIGSHVASKFAHAGYSVVGVDDLSSGHIQNIPKNVEFIKGDLSNSTFISKLPKDCTHILHLAGQSSGEISFDDPIGDLYKNTASTINLIKFGIQNYCEKIIYASSMSVYGEVDNRAINELHECSPLSCYGVSKLASERYLNVYRHQIPFVCMRMFNVYGPGQDLINLRQGMVSIFLAQALSRGHINVNGSIKRFRD